MGGSLIVQLLPLLAAPFVGSFLGVLIRRLPRGQPLVVARSACESCGRALGPAELIPLASFLALRGRCRGCGAAIARFHPAVELAALAIAVVAAATGTGSADIWAGCGLGWTLLTLAWIDLEHMVLPDELTLPLLLAGLGVTWWLDPDALADRAAAATIGYAAFLGIAWAFLKLRGRDGLGQGDAKLLAAGGAWVGLAALSWVVLAAALLGLGTAWVQQRRGRDIRGEIPFGPALALAIWLRWIIASA